MFKLTFIKHFCLAGAGLTVNGADVVKGDTPVARGNIMFVSEVLFVNETVVQQLHQKHRDKETPPLLAFPWFGAQFLSHAFLALERSPRFTHITRFLNMADLAPHIAGAGGYYYYFLDQVKGGRLTHLLQSATNICCGWSNLSDCRKNYGLGIAPVTLTADHKYKVIT